MSITQDGRLLRIDTPLGKDYLLLNELELTEELSDLFYCKVQLLHGEETKDYEPTEIDAASILGQNVTVMLKQSDGTTRKLNGIVNSFSTGDRDARFSYYQATIVPRVWLLTQNIQSRIFQHKSVPEIVKEILEDFDFSMQVQDDFKPRNYCVQYQESDFQFIRRILEEEGIYFYFEHTDTSHKMIIADTPKSHQDAPTKNSITYLIKLDNEKKFVPRINNLWTDYKLQTGQVAYRDYHFQTPTNQLETQQPSFYPVANNQKLELYDYPGGYARKYDAIDRMGEEDGNGLEGLFPDKQRTVKNMMNALDSQYNVLTGTSNCCSLIAGHKFRLIEHPNKKLNAQYIVTSITHKAHQSPNYHSNEEAGEPYNNNFEIIPYGQGVPPYCPPRKTPKPVMQGCQTATVVGPSGEEIFTDKYGRVKIEFHWDRDGKADGNSSCWVRSAKDSAGNKYGSMYIPRIGQEVIVDFIGGDCDRPIITGSVYNAQTMPHYELPKYKTLSYIKTRTSPDDGKGFNELRFEDKKDKEQVFIHSQKRMDTRVRGSFYETCGGNRQERIGVRTDNQPGGKLAITVGGNHEFHIKGDQFIAVDGKLNETVKADVVEDYQGKQYTQIKGVRELNAQSITLEATTEINLKVGGSFVKIDLSGVTISGPMVKINSGGAAKGTSPADIDDPLDAESADTGEPGYLDRPRSGGGRGRNRRTLRGQHAPPFETKTLSNGDIQVGNGFIIKKSATDPDFQQKVLDDMTEMNNHPTGMETLNRNNNSGQTTTIQHTNGGNSTTFENWNDGAANGKPAVGGGTGTGNGTGSTIDYNPDREPPTAANPSVNRPADVGLNHEMVHAYHGAEGTDDNSLDPANPNNPTVEETETINKDNDYRKERGIPTRADHTVL